eukprot:CAMPEP_0206142638 /NCGR_PEP_ID=MMETSP1473-20131121/17761_1 /ASSEMBLY_ACC=CAM_ASM_001109 /TAXON_ID=1461547 /ORGANISM="Stichococcus sp, Strain RCC1054" /LENGTH=82 /DNA_ID=CAMNT_0053537723 /DNA_START=58 /DNA_END=306 /DNA_ORIENTATION=-
MAPPRGGLNFLRGGLPFIVLTVGGWLGISHFLSGKFELRDAQQRYVELKPAAQNQGASLEAELEKTQRRLNLDYENKPVPKL